MKNIYWLVFAFFLLSTCSSSNSIFELSPSQSMSIVGKGQGQDAAYNPYAGENSLAVVKNLGKNSFTVRIQQNGEIIETLAIQPNEKRRLLLREGYELYLDSDLKSKARVHFKKYKS